MTDSLEQTPYQKPAFSARIFLPIAALMVILFVSAMSFLMDMKTDSNMETVARAINNNPEEFRLSHLTHDVLKKSFPEAKTGFLVGFSSDRETRFGDGMFLTPHLPVLCLENEDGSHNAFLVDNKSGSARVTIREGRKGLQSAQKLDDLGFCDKAFKIPAL